MVDLFLGPQVFANAVVEMDHEVSESKFMKFGSGSMRGGPPGSAPCLEPLCQLGHGKENDRSVKKAETRLEIASLEGAAFGKDDGALFESLFKGAFFRLR